MLNVKEYVKGLSSKELEEASTLVALEISYEAMEELENRNNNNKNNMGKQCEKLERENAELIKDKLKNIAIDNQVCVSCGASTLHSHYILCRKCRNG